MLVIYELFLYNSNNSIFIYTYKRIQTLYSPLKKISNFLTIRNCSLNTKKYMTLFVFVFFLEIFFCILQGYIKSNALLKKKSNIKISARFGGIECDFNSKIFSINLLPSDVSNGIPKQVQVIVKS
jgi:hypothetical protein